MATNMDNLFLVECSVFVPEDDLEEEGSTGYDSDVSENNDGSSNTCLQKFLAVIAPSESQPGTSATQNEVNKRLREFEKFLERQLPYPRDDQTITVDSFDKLKSELTKFCCTLGRDDFPTIIFFGHGSDDGQLCFQRGGKPADEALKAVQKCFHDNRPKEMPAHQCRVVFAQCHAHHVDGKNEPGVVHAVPGEGGIEYIYFTSTEATVTSTGELAMESDPIFNKFHSEIPNHKVYFKPPMTIPRIKDEVSKMKGKVCSEKAALEQQIEQMTASSDDAKKSQLKEELKTLNTLTNSSENRRKYLLDGPPTDLMLTANILKYVRKWREEELKMFLHITVQHSPSSDPPEISTLHKLTENDFVVKSEGVQSRVDFKQKVGDFLVGPAANIIMPIILVAGNIVQHEQSSKLKLVFSDHPDGIPIIELFSEHITEAAGRCNPRILFVGPGTHSGNAVAPLFQNKQLQLYCSKVTGEGPKNKPPSGDPSTDVDPTRDAEVP